MILIADSGSTKTDWRVLNSDIQFTTAGIHPLMLDKNSIFSELKNQFKTIDKETVKSIFFYGAGCGTPERSEIILHLLSDFFTKATIEVHSDLYAAARALFQSQSGIACILGTGANSGYYDGAEIRQKARSLGYILGDEGSGAYLGKQIISTFLKQAFEPDLQSILENKITMDVGEIIDKVYRQPYPNRFLASFTPLTKAYIQFESMQKICRSSFDDFFKQYLLIYDNVHSLKVSFVGSIAFHFQDMIKEIAENYNISIGQFVEKPIGLLIQYHQKEL